MKIAVIGSGVSGLGAVWLLNEHSDHEVHLYEEESRPGGHANTVAFQSQDSSKNAADVDTGFIVLNPPSYPNFNRFLVHKNVRTVPTEMTFSVSRDQGAFEWAGNNLFTVFCQPSRLLDQSMWRLIYDVLRFNACARRILLSEQRKQSASQWSIPDDMSIGEYLQREGYSASFSDNYLIPMTAAIWSTPPDKCALDFPALTLLRFMYNHHLLQLVGKPSWLTILGGSKVYVQSILASLPEGQIHLSTAITSVRNVLDTGKVAIATAAGEEVLYDHVILACHSDQALCMLRAGNGVTADEERILGRFQWNKNEAVLHEDLRLMPKSRLAWTCWNYLTRSTVDSAGKRRANNDAVSLTYWMNDLQSLSEKQHGTILVTLNPPFEPNAVMRRYIYDHPVLDSEAVRSQAEMPTIQNTRGISYAGAYLKYGFHEDGFTSGLRVAAGHLGARPPFKIKDPDRALESIWPALLFDAFESSGMRTVVGSTLGLLLYLCRSLIGLLVDLRHLTA